MLGRQFGVAVASTMAFVAVVGCRDKPTEEEIRQKHPKIEAPKFQDADCFAACVDCTNACNGKSSCTSQCFQASGSCCAKAGAKPLSGACGCNDK